MIKSDSTIDVVHNKTGNFYKILDSTVINTTNAAGGDVVMILYQNQSGQLFVRDDIEFRDKFTIR